MNSNYGNYIPTGVLSSPGLYNESAWQQGWLPSWANLRGGIMGPLYTPAIRDPAVVEAIRRGSWDFTTEGTMFDPQGNYDLVPGAIPMHRYSGRSMTWHGADGFGDFGAGLFAVTSLVGRLVGAWKDWVGGLSPAGKAVYWAAVAALGVAVVGRTKIGRMLKMGSWPVLGQLAGKLAPGKFLSVSSLTGGKGPKRRRNRGKRRSKRVSKPGGRKS